MIIRALAALPPLETSGRSAAVLGRVESLQAMPTKAAATTPDNTQSLDPNMTSASRNSAWRAAVALPQGRCQDMGAAIPARCREMRDRCGVTAMRLRYVWRRNCGVPTKRAPASGPDLGIAKDSVGRGPQP